jgi:glycosyltransferase involved in cell wall biosynthesis
LSSVDALPLARRIHVMQFIGNNIVGGMETYVKRLIERLPAERFRITAVCPYESRYSESLRERGAEVLILSMPDDPSWASICSTAAYVAAEQVDVLQCHLTNAHILGGVVGKLTGVPVLYTAHGRRLESEDIEVHRLTGTHLGVVCRFTQMHAIGLGVAPEMVHLLPNGVDVDLFRPQRLRDGPLRREYGIPADAPLVGFVGRLSQEKGPETFLRSMLLAHQAVPDVHVAMVGTGPMEPNVQAFIRNFNMGDWVHLAGLRDDVPGLLRELDIFVSSSHSEAMPLAMMEAMACGLPIVGTRVGGVPDLILHGESGYLVDRADINAISSAVRGLLQEPELRERMGAVSRERAVRQFSLTDSLARTQELLLRLAAQQHSATAAPAPLAANEAIKPKLVASSKAANPARGARSNGVAAATASAKPS